MAACFFLPPKSQKTIDAQDCRKQKKGQKEENQPIQQKRQHDFFFLQPYYPQHADGRQIEAAEAARNERHIAEGSRSYKHEKQQRQIDAGREQADSVSKESERTQPFQRRNQMQAQLFQQRHLADLRSTDIEAADFDQAGQIVKRQIEAEHKALEKQERLIDPDGKGQPQHKIQADPGQPGSPDARGIAHCIVPVAVIALV